MFKLFGFFFNFCCKRISFASGHLIMGISCKIWMSKYTWISSFWNIVWNKYAKCSLICTLRKIYQLQEHHTQMAIATHYSVWMELSNINKAQWKGTTCKNSPQKPVILNFWLMKPLFLRSWRMWVPILLSLMS